MATLPSHHSLAMRVYRPLPRRALRIGTTSMATGPIAIPAGHRVPNELLRIVLKNLALNKSLHTLANFAQTNHAWYLEASELLWMDVPATAIIWCSLVDYYTDTGSGFDQTVDLWCSFVNKYVQGPEGLIKLRALEVRN